MPPEIRVIGVEGMPEAEAGDDLAAQIMDACQNQGTRIEAGDVLVVTQKIVSKAEGRVVAISTVVPSPLALAISEGHRRDPRHTELILRESKRIVRMDGGVIISETHHGFRHSFDTNDANFRRHSYLPLVVLRPSITYYRDAVIKATMEGGQKKCR